jgi:osmotically-inducible protein OsmY
MKKFLVTMMSFALVLSFSAGAAAAPSVVDVESMVAAKLVDVFGNDGKTIRVTWVDGKAILTGKVVERSTQELAEQVALYFPEVKKVDNQLKAEKDRNIIDCQLKDESMDATLESEAKSALAGEIGSHAKDIEVEAADGVIAIRGSVPDESRHKLALDSLKKNSKITKVIDLLRVK